MEGGWKENGTIMESNAKRTEKKRRRIEEEWNKKKRRMEGDWMKNGWRIVGECERMKGESRERRRSEGECE